MKKILLHIGANSDMGHAISLKFATHDYNLAAHYHTHHDNAAKLKTDAENKGAEVLLLQGDLTPEGVAENIVQQTMQRFSRIDLLINSIGPFLTDDLLEQTPKTWHEVMDLNLNVVYDTIYYAKKPLLAAKGSIINFGYAGVEFLQSKTEATAFCAAKAGLVVLTKSLATRLAGAGVRVNMVCPGAVEESFHTEERKKEIAKDIPSARMGKHEEIASLVFWLAAESPAYITGSMIPISGGWDY